MQNSFRFLVRVVFFISITAVGMPAFSQAELQPWGNLAGIRIEGQLVDFETNISVVKKGWQSVKSTGKEQQRPHYERKAEQQIVTTVIDSLYFTETVTDEKNHTAKIDVVVNAHENSMLEGVFVKLLLPDVFYPMGTLMYDQYEGISLTSNTPVLSNYLRKPVKEIHLMTAERDLFINFETPTTVIFRSEKSRNGIMHHSIYIPVQKGDLLKGATAQNSFSIRTTGMIDKSPVSIQLNSNTEGRSFDGFGGNFRLQNPVTDPQVIDYCLNNMQVTWGRVEMPWRFWQVNKSDNPIDSANSGHLHPAVQHAMEMAQRLSKKSIPVILSCWSAPAWAVVGTPKFSPGPDGVWGNPLDTANMQSIYQSIADYVQVLKDKYGVEISLFSFNESDLGITIRQTGLQHAALIKGLGAYFESRGLKTKMLLGDNSDATTYEFIYPAMEDSACRPYIGAISFHSWRGWEKETLQKWADAATALKRPLIVGEGSIDAQAWGYPGIFEESSYALDEINLYTRLLNICQPVSILQWQLTADYSPLAGGGIFGNNAALHPTQRFYNLKQLASTPAGLKSLDAGSDKSLVSVAALGDASKNIYTIHLVNNGAERMAIIKGLPSTVKSFKLFITDKEKQNAEGKKVNVSNGIATVTLKARSFITLTTN